MVAGNAPPSDQGSAETSQSQCAGQGIVSRAGVGGGGIGDVLLCEKPQIDEPAEGSAGGLHRAERAWKQMTTREAWPQPQAQMSESVGGGRQAEQAAHAIMHCK